MKTVLLVLALGGMLALVTGFALDFWLELNEVEISTAGLLAMTAGVLASLGLGIGLMWLVFKSDRDGMDR